MSEDLCEMDKQIDRELSACGCKSCERARDHYGSGGSMSSTGSTLGPYILGYDAGGINLSWGDDICAGTGPIKEPITAAPQSDGRTNPVTSIDEREQA